MNDYLGQIVHFADKLGDAFLPQFDNKTAIYVSAAAIFCHVMFYDMMALIEYNTHIMTRLLGKNAVYYYSALIFTNSLIRDYYALKSMEVDAGSFDVLDPTIALYVGTTLVTVGLLLNLEVLRLLGIRGMYNGDSFGFLFDQPFVDGVFRIPDPQYTGAAMAFFGYAIKTRSLVGLGLAMVASLTYIVSVTFIEGPHLVRIYSERKTKSSKKHSNGSSNGNGIHHNGNGHSNGLHKEE
ncbi:hypothetical protein SmJEL517_g01088 [Synchytrium microbalum]|uniref:Phosphatidyl-N-methylethanolamine N-methyltransferase n=1 Tax=Synchytrium microbalum TaxID=1806994 RepID=A0A507CH81_9FUNG|nr:uncharacterized protein SmJEL517_g01088 [Synchytrium microbalum]TPX36913.1 hypothetical protein SmJEL517_g01088 [Synchytrium microbalum]